MELFEALSCTGSGMRGNLSSILWKGTVLATSLEAMSSSVPGLCLLHTRCMLGDRDVMMEHHRHGVLQSNKMQIMGGSDLALQLNGWYLPIARHDLLTDHGVPQDTGWTGAWQLPSSP